MTTTVNMDAVSTWIVPYISGDLVPSVPVFGVAVRGRCPDLNDILEICLSRITVGVLNEDDPVVSKIIQDIWEHATDTWDATATHIIALAHGYPKAVEYIENMAPDNRMAVLGLLRMVELHEKHWDLYVHLIDLAGHIAITSYIYETAIANRFKCVDKIPLCKPIVVAAIKHYRPGDTHLYNTIADGIRNGIVGGSDVGNLVRIGNFDNIIAESANVMQNKEIVRNIALSLGKDELAMRL